MISIRSLLLPAALVFAAATGGAAYAQDNPEQSAPAATPGKNDIVVTGQKKYEAPPRNPMPGESGATSKGVAASAGTFARCLNGSAPKLQRAIVEGHYRDGASRAALDKLIRSHAGCYPAYRTTAGFKIGHFGDCNPVMSGLTQGSQAADMRAEFVLCRAPYDRLAIVEEAFLTYAPHFRLMRGDTFNKDTIARFRAREEVRGKYRTPLDRTFYTTIACMVQIEPENAVRLLHAQASSDEEARLRKLILDKTSYCTGEVKDVQVDPPQFRGYVADAAYHWTIAAKNVETLIPAR